MTRFLYPVRHGQAEPHDEPLSAAGQLTASPAALISLNDAGHLPPQLRWTGFPATLKPASG